jgi:hypothetical protein
MSLLNITANLWNFYPSIFCINSFRFDSFSLNLHCLMIYLSVFMHRKIVAHKLHDLCLDMRPLWSRQTRFSFTCYMTCEVKEKSENKRLKKNKKKKTLVLTYKTCIANHFIGSIKYEKIMKINFYWKHKILNGKRKNHTKGF